MTPSPFMSLFMRLPRRSARNHGWTHINTDEKTNGCRAFAPIGVHLCLSVVASFLIAGLSQAPLGARQRPDPNSQPRIRSEVSLVSVISSVLDKNNRPAL